jgi:hypothetical protein
MDPPLEGHLEVRGIGANGAQQPAAHARELDRRPLHALDLAAPLKRQAALCADRPDQAADAGARLERADVAVAADEARQQRADHVSDRIGEHGRGVVGVDQAEGLGLELGRILIPDLLDREAAVPL